MQSLITSQKFILDLEDLFGWCKPKKVISISCSSSKSSWKPWKWVRLDLIFKIRDRYVNSNLNPLATFTSSSRSTKFKDIPPWNISHMITEVIPVSMRIVISYAMMKWGIPLWHWRKVNGNWDSNIRICQWRESHFREILAWEEINKSKRAGPYKSQSQIWVGKLTIWVRSL